MKKELMRYGPWEAFFFVVWAALTAAGLILFFGTLLHEIVEKW